MMKHPIRLRRAALPLLLASLLSGCAIGPDFLRPVIELPQRFTRAAPEPIRPNPEVETAWWRHFQDPLLDDLVDRALARNASVLTAVARVEEAEAAAREAGAAFLPQIDLQGSAARNRISTSNAQPIPAGVPVIRNARGVALTTSYELDVWGRVRRANEAVRAQMLASHYARDAVSLSVAGLVAANYLALRAADAQLAVTAESLASRQETLQLVRTRVAGGIASPLEQAQAEGELAAIQAQEADLRRQRSLVLHQLALLTGTPDLSVEPGDLRRLPTPPIPPAGLPSSLVEGRPDVRQAEENLIAANAGIGVAKAGYFPRFALTGSLGTESAAMANLFGAGANTWSLGLSALMPLLDFGRTSARVDQASARERQAAIAYRNTLETAFKEVRDALVALFETGTAEAAQQARVDAARQALDIARKRYEAGYSGYLEVLDAQRTANTALTAYVGTRQARLASAVDLFKALGGGWKDGFKTAEVR